MANHPDGRFDDEENAGWEKEEVKTVIKLEARGDNMRQRVNFYVRSTNEQVPGLGDYLFGDGMPSPPCWCAKITGRHADYKWAREFQKGKKDYSQANSAGSRGVYVWYFLEPGIYQTHERISWTRSSRHFLEVTDGGEIKYIDEKDVESRFPLSEDWEPPF